LPEADELASVWSQMTELRNDIAHCGMNNQPQDAAKLKKSSSLSPKLKQLGGTTCQINRLENIIFVKAIALFTKTDRPFPMLKSAQ
jgi:hypothetical protein